MNKVNSVEGLRGVAATIVVFSHFCYVFFPFLHRESNSDDNVFLFDLPFGFIYSGTFAVYVFFVLSGYILSYISEKYTNGLFVLSIKRYLRLGIPVFISVLVAYSFFIFFNVDKSDVSSWIFNYGNFDYSFFGAIYNALFESFIIGKSDYNFVFWTMQIEFFGSLIIYLIYIQKYFKYNHIVLVFLTGIIFLYIFHIISSKLLLGLISIVIGSIIYEKGRELKSTFSILLFIFALYLAGVHSTSLSYTLLYSIFGNYTYELGNFFAGIIIVYTVLYSKFFSEFFSNRLCVFLGKVSFSVYLIHLPIISVFSIYVFNIFYKSYSLSYLLSVGISFILTLVLIFTSAQYYYKYVDVLALNVSKKVANYISFLIKGNK